jgi:hypothetical protein
MMFSRMFCARTVTFLLLLILPCVSFAAQQQRKRTTAKPKTTASAPAPKPTTLLGCGVSMRVPPGWEVSLAKAPEVAPSITKPSPPETEPKQDDSATSPATDDTTKDAKPSPPKADSTPEMPPCSFIAAPKAPSALLKNTETDGPIGQMELRVMEGDLDTAAAVLFQKDEKGWFVQDSNGVRSDAKLTKQKTMQILSGVIVQRCYDRSGKSRGLCEVSKYVYSNGRKNLLVTAGPYIGETEYVILSSVRFAPATSTAKTRPKR